MNKGIWVQRKAVAVAIAQALWRSENGWYF